MESNKQHVQVPNGMTERVEPKDLVIYASIKRFMNNKTREAYPSLDKIHQLTSADIKTIRASIKRLQGAGYITVSRRGRSNIYTFSTYKNFEPFSYDFLDKPDLTFTEKAYILASQQYMYKEFGKGKISYSNQALSNLINMPLSTIYKCNASLKRKEYLTEVLSEKIFHLNELGQAIIFTLQDHEDRITENSIEIEKLKQQIASLRKDNELLIRSLPKETFTL